MDERTGYYSERLELGSVYTRRQLKEQFSITDSTINNGVFSRRGGDPCGYS